MFIIVAIFIKFFAHVKQVHVRRCHFSVMFKDFGHIDSVMLTTLDNTSVYFFYFLFVENSFWIKLTAPKFIISQVIVETKCYLM